LNSETIEQLELHPLSSLWAPKNTTDYIRARWKIVLEYGLPSTLHINKHGLSEVPPQKLVWWPLRIIEKSLVKMPSSITLKNTAKIHNLVIILK
jgi:hypothetical protein